MFENTLAVILAEGEGAGLMPLTKDRTKSAIPFGGKYRVIDFALSNCLQSGLRRILVLTQYKSHSLNKHIRDGWSLFNPELGEYITLVPPQMHTGDLCYTGSADAVFQNLYMLRRSGAERVLIAPGDQIYRMDYGAFMRFHESSGADISVACASVEEQGASKYGAVTLSEEGAVTGWSRSDESSGDAPVSGSILSAMGIYIFSIDALIDVLEESVNGGKRHVDFDSEILPGVLERMKVHAYRFGGESGRVSQDGYWRDMESVDAFYEANMELLNPIPALDLYQPEWPIRSYQAQYPPTRTVPGDSGSEGIFVNSIASGGVLIVGGVVQHSVLFPRVRIGEEAVVHDAILFDDVVVGEGVQLERCIVEKGVAIPAGEMIGFDKAQDAERFFVTDKGVVVVPKGYVFT